MIFFIAPARHKTKDHVSDLFEDFHDRPRKTSVPDRVNEAHQILREEYFCADVGTSGGTAIRSDRCRHAGRDRRPFVRLDIFTQKAPALMRP